MLIVNAGKFYAKIWGYFLQVFGAMTPEKSGNPKSRGGRARAAVSHSWRRQWSPSPLPYFLEAPSPQTPLLERIRVRKWASPLTACSVLSSVT